MSDIIVPTYSKATYSTCDSIETGPLTNAKVEETLQDPTTYGSSSTSEYIRTSHLDGFIQGRMIPMSSFKCEPDTSL